LNLLHTVSPEIETNPELIEKARKQLKKLIPEGANLAYEVFAECGSSEENILRAAEDTGVDLIVMGVSRTALPAARAHLPGPIAHKVVCRAPCPVLTVPK
jgi:nucleotide-binding universal stress UspA family protein